MSKKLLSIEMGTLLAVTPLGICVFVILVFSIVGGNNVKDISTILMSIASFSFIGLGIIFYRSFIDILSD